MFGFRALDSTDRLGNSLLLAAREFHQQASEAAMMLAGALLICGALGGVLLARWVLRGGLSRFQARAGAGLRSL